MREKRVIGYIVIFLLFLTGCSHSHSYKEKIIAPTCTTQGYITYICSCGDVKTENYIQPYGHDFDLWETIKEPTEEEEGIKERYCKICLEKQTEEIPAKNHIHEYSKTIVAPTCMEDGYTENICKCGHSFKSDYIKANHTEEIIPGKQGTCEENGLTEGKKCSVCNKVLVEQEIIPALGHTEEIIPSKQGTCEENGLTEGKKCSVCNKVLLEQEVVPALGHTEEIIPSKQETCEENGLTEGKKCNVCDKVLVEQEIIPALGHTEEIIPGKEATCKEIGLTEGKKCSVCDSIIVKQEYISMINHVFDFFTNTCLSCGDKQYFEVRTENELKAADYNGKDMVIFMDYCISVEETNIYWILSVAPETKYIRLIGTVGEQYNFCLNIDEARIEPLKIDLVDTTIKTIVDRPIINSLSNVPLFIGMYGKSSQIIGKNGKNGENGSVLSFSYDGERGYDGNIAINSNGDVTIYIESNNVVIKGGNGGTGGKGMNAAPAPQDGGNGGAGGNGAYAIRASSVKIQFSKGYNSSNLNMTGGAGGDGGAGGSGFLWGKDGKQGSKGKTALATNVIISYE